MEVKSRPEHRSGWAGFGPNMPNQQSLNLIHENPNLTVFMIELIEFE